jgi:hypothetical protein
MAVWKKVIVSGSNAQVNDLFASNSITGSIISGSRISGSFSGSYEGDGSNLTGVTAAQLPTSLTDGSGIIDFTFNGSSAATVSVDSGSLAGAGLATSTGKFLVGADNGITASADAIGIQKGGVNNDRLANDGLMIGSTDISLGATGSTVAGLTLTGAEGSGSFSGSFEGTFTGTSNLPDLTDGNGIADFTYDGSSTATVAVQADGSTLSVGASGVKVADAGITETQLNTSIAGNGLTGGAGTPLSVVVDDSSIEIDTDTLRVKALGVTNAMLAGSIANSKLSNSSITVTAGDALTGGGSVSLGSSVTLNVGVDNSSIEVNSDALRVKAAGITNAMLVNDGLMLGSTDISLGTTGSTVAGLTLTGVEASGSFSGSFEGDGSGLTGIASSLAFAGESGTGTVALKTQTFTITGGEGIDTTAGTQTLTIAGEDATSANKGIASFSDSNFTVSSGDVSLSQDVLIQRDLTVSRNLTVAGTASFQHTEDLDVADRFIRLASGSTTTGDGGIVIQQEADEKGEAFAFDSGVSRWGVTSSYDASTNTITPEAFMAAVVIGSANDPTAAPTRYQAKGNIFIANNEDIYIYS